MLFICRRLSDCYRCKLIHIIEHHLQQCLNKLLDWADTNVFKFSLSKTVCIHFCKLRKPHPEPTLLLNSTFVPVVEETKFLGVIFDRKLSFIPHIKHLKDKCTKALYLQKRIRNNMLKVLTCPPRVLLGIQDGVQDGRRIQLIYIAYLHNQTCSLWF